MYRRSRPIAPTHARVGSSGSTREGRIPHAAVSGDDSLDENRYFGYFFFFYAFESAGGMNT